MPKIFLIAHILGDFFCLSARFFSESGFSRPQMPKAKAAKTEKPAKKEKKEKDPNAPKVGFRIDQIFSIATA